MAFYRKKPVVIEAVKVSDALRWAGHDWKALPEWLRVAYEAGVVVFGLKCVHIHTSEGDMVGRLTDWIIMGVKGELYPCKPDVFAATYEETEGSSKA